MVLALAGSSDGAFDTGLLKPGVFSSRGPARHWRAANGAEVVVVGTGSGAGTGNPNVCWDERRGAIVFGRISNHREVRAHLDGLVSPPPDSPPGRGDADLAVRLFEQFGHEAFARLDGSCAGFVFHEDRAALFAGKVPGQPLYYTVANGAARFSSELKPLFAAAGRPASVLAVDEAMLAAQPELTPLAGCFRLLPGTALVMSRGTEPRLLRYPPGEPGPPIVDAADAARRLMAALDRAVAAWATGESVTCLISGGVDSAIVSVLAARYANDLRLATIDLGGRNEFERADRVAARLGRPCARLYVDERDLLPGFGAVAQHAEHWFSQYLEYLAPFYLGLKALGAAGGLVLSGYGSDILFGGLAATELDESGIARHVAAEFQTAVWANEFAASIGGGLGIEVGYPFFDSQVIATWAATPDALKYRHRHNKYLLRAACEPQLGPEIAWQPKVGIHESTGFEALLTRFLAPAGPSPVSRSDKDRFARMVWDEVVLNGTDPGCVPYASLAAR